MQAVPGNLSALCVSPPGCDICSHAEQALLRPPLSQAILGVILVKELVLVDEDAGVRVGQLRIRDAPFIRQAQYHLAV